MASQHGHALAAANDLISFLKELPDCRMRRGIRFPQKWMLLVAILTILSSQGSLVGMERFAKRRRQTLKLLGTEFRKSPADSTFRLLLPSWICRDLIPCQGTGWRASRAWQRRLAPWCVATRCFKVPPLGTTPLCAFHRSREPLLPAAGCGYCQDHLRH